MDDNSIMPWGIYKGKKMANVPDDYLRFIYKLGKCDGAVKAYIEENADSLKIEIKK